MRAADEPAARVSVGTTATGMSKRNAPPGASMGDLAYLFPRLAGTKTTREVARLPPAFILGILGAASARQEIRRVTPLLPP